MIQKATDLIKEHKNIEIDPDDIPLDDLNTFNLLARGELQGIFQLESSGMRQVVKDLKPSNLEDISSILALYRPGPLDAGLIPKFINRKHGREVIDYPHDLIKPILHETYGIMVYQEQIMKIAQDMAGYSLGQADLLRRAMGKKKVAEMEKHRTIFIEGAEEKGVQTKIASDLFDQMILFAEYCLSADTEILTLEHGWVPLGTIVNHELDCHVFSVNSQGHLMTQPIAQWHHRGEQEIFEYELADGRIIRATANHQFLTDTGVMMAIDDIFEQGLHLHQLPIPQNTLAQAV